MTKIFDIDHGGSHVTLEDNGDTLYVSVGSYEDMDEYATGYIWLSRTEALALQHAIGEWIVGAELVA